MSKSKFKKSISLILSAVLLSTILPCSASNLVPVGGQKVITAPPTPMVKSKNAPNDFSIQSVKTKFNKLMNSQRSKPELQETSGSCGENVSWSINNKGELTIYGVGDMADYEKMEEVPWYNTYRDSIESVTIKSGVTSIGKYAFAGCDVLSSVQISDSVTTIGDMAFMLCGGLKSVTIPKSITSIGQWAFSLCYSLTSIKIPHSVTSIGNMAFGSCKALEFIDVDVSNPTYKSIDGVLFSIGGDSTRLKQYPMGKKATKYTIPSSVGVISDSAFRDCRNLHSIMIPASVTYIDDRAFQNCALLGSVKYDGLSDPRVHGIGDINSVFKSCNSLHKIKVPAKYEDDAFCGMPISKPGLSKGAIAGIVSGSVATLAAAVVGTVLLLKYKCFKHPQENSAVLDSLV